MAWENWEGGEYQYVQEPGWHRVRCTGMHTKDKNGNDLELEKKDGSAMIPYWRGVFEVVGGPFHGLSHLEKFFHNAGWRLNWFYQALGIEVPHDENGYHPDPDALVGQDYVLHLSFPPGQTKYMRLSDPDNCGGHCPVLNVEEAIALAESGDIEIFNPEGAEDGEAPPF